MIYFPQYHYHCQQPDNSTRISCQYWQDNQQNLDTPLKRLLLIQQQSTNQQMRPKCTPKTNNQKQINIHAYRKGISVGKLKGNHKQLSMRQKFDQSYQKGKSGQLLCRNQNKKAKSIEVICRKTYKAQDQVSLEHKRKLYKPIHNVIRGMLKQQQKHEYLQKSQEIQYLPYHQLLLKENREISKLIEQYEQKIKQQDQKNYLTIKNIGETKALVSKLQKEYFQALFQMDANKKQFQRNQKYNFYDQENYQTRYLHSLNIEKQGQCGIQYESIRQPRNSILNHLTKKYYFDSHFFKQLNQDFEYSLFSKNEKSGRQLKEKHQKFNCSTDRCTQIEDRYKLSSKKNSPNESFISQNQFLKRNDNKKEENKSYQKSKQLQKKIQSKSIQFISKPQSNTRSIKSITIRPSYDLNRKIVLKANSGHPSQKSLRSTQFNKSKQRLKPGKFLYKKGEYQKKFSKMQKQDNNCMGKQSLAELLKQKRSYFQHKEQQKK